MEARLAVITGYAKDPRFVKILLRSLENQSLKEFDCFIYASPGCISFLEEQFLNSLHFKCYHIRLERNKGFAGNNNEMLEMAAHTAEYTHMALINDDTIPHPSFLEELLKTAVENSGVGAVAAKMVFYQPFVTLTGFTHVEKKKEGKRLGLRYYLNSHFDHTYYPKIFFKEGFGPEEEDEIGSFKWTDEKFTMQVPVLLNDQETYRFRLFISGNTTLQEQWLMLKIGGHVTKFRLDSKRIYYPVDIPKKAIEDYHYHIIQNAGGLLSGIKTVEIGFGEIDTGQYNHARPVDLFCGGACLLSWQALKAAGLFLEGYFNYYEDSDLSVRMRKKGFQILYNPSAVIRHFHAGTTREWSPFFTYYAFRNKIIFAKKNIGWRAFVEALGERAGESYRYLKVCIGQKFHNRQQRSALKLNLVILKDSLIGIARFKIKFPAK